MSHNTGTERLRPYGYHPRRTPPPSVLLRQSRGGPRLNAANRQSSSCIASTTVQPSIRASATKSLRAATSRSSVDTGDPQRGSEGAVARTRGCEEACCGGSGIRWGGLVCGRKACAPLWNVVGASVLRFSPFLTRNAACRHALLQYTISFLEGTNTWAQYAHDRASRPLSATAAFGAPCAGLSRCAPVSRSAFVAFMPARCAACRQESLQYTALSLRGVNSAPQCAHRRGAPPVPPLPCDGVSTVLATAAFATSCIFSSGVLPSVVEDNRIASRA